MLKNFETRIEGFLDRLQKVTDKEAIASFFQLDVKHYIEKIDQISASLKTHSTQPKSRADFFQATDRVLLRGERLVDRISNPQVSKKVKKLFRLLIEKKICRGPIMKRAYFKPRGYPGDYKIIEAFYNDKLLTNGFGAYCDSYVLRDDYVQAIRDRKDKMGSLLKKFLLSSASRPKRILNLGCGGCRELRELPREDLGSAETTFILLDQDWQALTYSKRLLHKSSLRNMKFEFRQANVIDYARNPQHYYKQFTGLDLIYSIGLADYIPDLYLGGLIKSSYGFLRKKGVLIIAHKNITKHKSIASDWMCDWRFFPRSLSDVMTIAKNSLTGESFTTQVEWLPSKRVFFISIFKE